MTGTEHQRQSEAPSPDSILDQMLSTVEASALRAMAHRNEAIESLMLAGILADVFNEPARAIKSFTLALEMDSGNAMVLLLRASVFRDVGNRENELKDLRTCLPLLTGHSKLLATERIKSLEKEETKE